MNKVCIAVIASVALVPAAQAATVSIDLSSASSNLVVTAPGASFAQTFAGQTIVGNNGLSGSPTGPLSLAGVGSLTVEFFNPVVSPAARSIRSPANNQGPLAVLLDSYADDFSFTMGSAVAGSTVAYSLFGSTGNLLGGGQIVMNSGYALYSIGNAAAFRGISFFNNNDPAGVRFMNMSYTSGNAIPEPAAWAMLITGFGLVGAAQRRRAATAHA
jgi:hypothetical protein